MGLAVVATAGIGTVFWRRQLDVVVTWMVGERDRVVGLLRERSSELRAQGVRGLALFGSVARDEARPDSDVDLLVELDRDTKLGFGVVGLRDESAAPARPRGRAELRQPGGTGVPAPDRARSRAGVLSLAGRQRDWLGQIVREISLACRLAARHDRDSFAADEVAVAAMERFVERISEASRRLDPALKALEPAIPWAEIAGIGNILRHDYDRVDPAILWNIATRDLPVLAQAVERLLATLDPST